MLPENPSLLNEKNAVMAQTPLHVSAGYNRGEIIKFLLDWKGPSEVELEAKPNRPALLRPVHAHQRGSIPTSRTTSSTRPFTLVRFLDFEPDRDGSSPHRAVQIAC
ncbi:hypothetical protein C1H46_038221 [Malus baccata]|uniref:Uncharacterized protein n=1 Tax=Malus baccata TaxID=106549 RepID=A0A540KQG8_MALBA|nr:hypothetical protein C1H46_038221 [Malus baccata]